MMKLVLASKSPRRIELLGPVAGTLFSEGLLEEAAFAVCPSDFDEDSVRIREPEELVRCLSGGKAETVARTKGADSVVIGCDSVVALGGRIFGKPRDPADAAAMLTALSGRTHRVLTGVTILCAGERRQSVHSTEVTFYPLSPEEIARYCATPEPYDKAGGYGIQERGGLFVRCIAGDYSNVVGLPAAALLRELRKLLGSCRSAEPCAGAGNDKL